jgi:hypothetical protein
MKHEKSNTWGPGLHKFGKKRREKKEEKKVLNARTA